MRFKKKKPFFPGSALIRRLCRIIRIQNTVDLPSRMMHIWHFFDLMKRAYDVKHLEVYKAQEMPVLFVSGAGGSCMGNVRQFAKLSVPCVVQDTGMSGENYIRECATRS